MMQPIKDIGMPCPVCGNNNHTPSYRVKGYLYYLCNSCRSLFLDPASVHEDVSLYGKDYFEKDLKKDMRGYAGYAAQSLPLRMYFRRLLKYVKAYIPPDSPSLLDVGCAYGFFLDEAKKLGMSVHGVDISEDAINWVKERLRIEGTVGSISEAPIGPFDVITAIEVIEHINNPSSFLNSIRERLREDGIVVIHTAAVDSQTARLFGRSWWYLNPPDHCIIYSRDSLRSIVSRHGFEILEHRLLWLYWIGLNNLIWKFARLTGIRGIGWIATKLPSLPLPVPQFCAQLLIARKKGESNL